MSRSIRSYLPDPETHEDQDIFIKTRVTPSVARRLKQICLDNHPWTISSIGRAAIEKFVDDECPPSQYFKPKTHSENASLALK